MASLNGAESQARRAELAPHPDSARACDRSGCCMVRRRAGRAGRRAACAGLSPPSLPERGKNWGGGA
eukprot:15404110-Alexandrium_andersonii.AAC.1